MGSWNPPCNVPWWWTSTRLNTADCAALNGSELVFSTRFERVALFIAHSYNVIPGALAAAYTSRSIDVRIQDCICCVFKVLRLKPGVMKYHTCIAWSTTEAAGIVWHKMRQLVRHLVLSLGLKVLLSPQDVGSDVRAHVPHLHQEAYLS